MALGLLLSDLLVDGDEQVGRDGIKPFGNPHLVSSDAGLFPDACEHVFGGARKEHVPLAIPFDDQGAARKLHVDGTVGEAVKAGSDGNGASARAAGEGLADAALPDTGSNVTSIDYVNYFEIDACGEEGVIFDSGADV